MKLLLQEAAEYGNKNILSDHGCMQEATIDPSEEFGKTFDDVGIEHVWMLKKARSMITDQIKSLNKI
ncbi:hypothetical protein [Methanococcoides sp. FTZ1]|uniref:hypothetical protein n=1 Tax=Methanococcoides sp. FTZ1 TaxID=3439061 RepID=UPI003F87C156